MEVGRCRSDSWRNVGSNMPSTLIFILTSKWHRTETCRYWNIVTPLASELKSALHTIKYQYLYNDSQHSPFALHEGLKWPTHCEQTCAESSNSGMNQFLYKTDGISVSAIDIVRSSVSRKYLLNIDISKALDIVGIRYLRCLN